MSYQTYVLLVIFNNSTYVWIIQDEITDIIDNNLLYDANAVFIICSKLLSSHEPINSNDKSHKSSIAQLVYSENIYHNTKFVCVLTENKWLSKRKE